MAPERSSDVPTDFAVAVTREDGAWVVSNLPPRAADHLEALVHALKQLPAEGGAIGLVSYVEEFFLVARTTPDDVRLLLSDIGAAPEWPLGAEVLEHLGLPMPDDEDLEQVQPAGDIALLQDLGLDAMELSMLCENLDLYADEALSAVAARLGFGEQFEQVLDSVLD